MDSSRTSNSLPVQTETGPAPDADKLEEQLREAALRVLDEQESRRRNPEKERHSPRIVIIVVAAVVALSGFAGLRTFAHRSKSNAELRVTQQGPPSPTHEGKKEQTFKRFEIRASRGKAMTVEICADGRNYIKKSLPQNGIVDFEFSDALVFRLRRRDGIQLTFNGTALPWPKRANEVQFYRLTTELEPLQSLTNENSCGAKLGSQD